MNRMHPNNPANIAARREDRAGSVIVTVLGSLLLLSILFGGF